MLQLKSFCFACSLLLLNPSLCWRAGSQPRLNEVSVDQKTKKFPPSFYHHYSCALVQCGTHRIGFVIDSLVHLQVQIRSIRRRLEQHSLLGYICGRTHKAPTSPKKIIPRQRSLWRVNSNPTTDTFRLLHFSLSHPIKFQNMRYYKCARYLKP